MEPDSPLRHTKHIFRVGLLFLVVLVTLLLGRSLFVPDTWGQYGWYRAASVVEYTNQLARHGGSESCRECHEDEFNTLTEAGHRSLACELCHAPLITHAVDGDKTADMPIQTTNELCTRCHQALMARPASFPQVQLRQHVEENDGEYSPVVCFDCHEPHSPL